MIDKGKSYKFNVEKTLDDKHQQWFDASIASDANGLA